MIKLEENLIHEKRILHETLYFYYKKTTRRRNQRFI